MTYSQRRKAAKKNARLSLKGNWGKSIAVWLILLAIIAGIVMLMAGTLYAASPADFDIAVSETGIHITQNPTAEQITQLGKQYDRFVSILKSEGRLAFEVFENVELAHTSPLGTGIIWGFSILMIILLIPLMFGICKFYLTMTDGDTPQISDMFSLFSSAKRFFGSFGLYFLIYLFTMLWSALVVAVWALIMGITVAVLVINAVAIETILITILALIALYLISFVFLTVFIMKYLAAPVIFVRGGGAYTSVRQSVAAMKKHRFEAFLFILSFLGWELLSALTLGLLYIYVLPYFLASYTSFITMITDGETKEEELPTYDSAPEIPNFTDFLPKE